MPIPGIPSLAIPGILGISGALLYDFDFDALSGQLPGGMTVSRASGGSYVDSNGLIQVAGNNTPRFDYNPLTLAARGLWIEEQRTNLNPESIDRGTTGTSTNGVTLTDYTVKGRTMVRATGQPPNPGMHYFFGGSAIPAGSTVHYLQAMVGPSSTGFVQLTTSGNHANDTPNTYLNFNTSTGAVAAAGSAISNVMVEDWGSGIYRIGFAFTTQATPTSGGAGIISYCSGAGDGRLPSGTFTGTIVAGALQLEVGSYPTSYIPTAGTAATRALEVPSCTPSWYSNVEGSCFVEYDAGIYAGRSPFMWSFDDGTTSNRWYGTSSTVSASSINSVAGVDQGTVTRNVAQAPNTVYRFAARVKPNDFRCAQNGTLGGFDVTGALTTGVTTLRLGQSPSGAITAALSGHIRRFKYIALGLTDTQLQEITA